MRPHILIPIAAIILLSSCGDVERNNERAQKLEVALKTSEAKLETLQGELDEKATELKQSEEKSAKFKAERDMLRTKNLALQVEIAELKAKLEMLMGNR